MLSFILISYFIVLIILGFTKREASKSTDANSYLLAGRKLSLPGFVITLVSTWYGGIIGIGENTYLYGLPMKLKDPGTILDPVVKRKKFKEKEYLVLKVTYEESVGKDTWYFYFNPLTFAMEVYQFFKDESKNDGEYILLNDEILVEGIKMPKNRSWYFNSNDKFLATDRLSVE